MIRFKSRYLHLLLLFSVVIFASCRKQNWEEHNQIVSQDLNKNLWQQVSSTPQLGIYTSLLKKLGYDSLLTSSKTYTIFAPDDNAINTGWGASVLNDTALVRKYVNNTIVSQAYFSSMFKGDALVIKALNDKNIQFTGSAIEGAAISSADKYVRNGVLHITGTSFQPKQNAWELLLGESRAPRLKRVIDSLSYTELDTSNAVKLYTDPITHLPVYLEGTALPIVKNKFFQRVGNWASEDSLMTCIILTDAALEAEMNKLRPFYKIEIPVGTSADSVKLLTNRQDSVIKWTILKDLVFPQVYDAQNLPDSLVSISGVKIHLNNSSIVRTEKLSNGIAFVVNHLDYNLYENKFPAIKIEGENWSYTNLNTSTLLTKLKRNPDGTTFRDMQVLNITTNPDPQSYVAYIQTLNAVKYRVYARAINDIRTLGVFNQKVDLSTGPVYPKIAVNTLQTTDYKPVEKNNYNEVFLGTLTASKYGNHYVFLVASTGASATGTPTGLSLDYLKLVPTN